VELLFSAMPVPRPSNNIFQCCQQ